MEISRVDIKFGGEFIYLSGCIFTA